MPGDDAMFQSLSGFHARCNYRFCLYSCLGGTVSIPVGFSRSLQLSPCPVEDNHRSVSIPVGFSRSLQLKSNNIVPLSKFCFNPCRVFTLAATQPVGSGGLPGMCFNPCRVFTLAATKAPRHGGAMVGRSFNPCRVFTLAATHP